MNFRIRYRFDNLTEKIDPEDVRQHDFWIPTGKSEKGDWESLTPETPAHVLEYWAEEVASFEAGQSPNIFEAFERDEEIVVTLLSGDGQELSKHSVSMRMEPVFMAERYKTQSQENVNV